MTPVKKIISFVYFYFFFSLIIFLFSGCLHSEKSLTKEENQRANQSIPQLALQTGWIPDSKLYFRITIIDEETGRGIPLVKLSTLNGIDHYTDSTGVVAFYEPGLMNKDVFFNVESHGYSFEKDAFDSVGKALKVVSGGSAILKMKRENIAQRLYRITGEGIYNDSILLGDKVPINNPLINSQVLGQDSTLITIYKGQLFWVWGDTAHPKHPIAGNFRTTCATSKLPSDSGLDPEIGVNLNYFTEGDFVKKMVPLPEEGLYWLSSLIAIKDKSGQERLIANYARIKAPMEAVGRGIVQFNDEKQIFEEIARNSLDDIIQPDGHPFKVTENRTEYYYFPYDTKFTRSKAEYESLIDRSTFEAFTCLREGCRFNCTQEQLDRDENDKLCYSWKKNTSSIGQKELGELVKKNLIKPEEKWFQLYDIDTGKEILYHNSSIYWNPYRNRWTMIMNEVFGTSLLGEIWYIEGDTPLGPWVYAKKVVTHKDYSCYNPVQHPYFMKENGRVIFFEGTYTMAFSGTKIPTPRYDYNQMMYKLELDDPRLFLPVPIYKVENEGTHYLTVDKIPNTIKEREIVFYAPDRQLKNTVPVYEIIDKKNNTTILTTSLSDDSSKKDTKVTFYAVSPVSSFHFSSTTTLYEYIHKQTGKRIYSTKESIEDTNYEQKPLPICFVWKKPNKFNPFKCK